MMESNGHHVGLDILILYAGIDSELLNLSFCLLLYGRFRRVRLFLLLREVCLLMFSSSTGTIKSADAVPKDTTLFQ